MSAFIKYLNSFLEKVKARIAEADRPAVSVAEEIRTRAPRSARRPVKRKTKKW